MTLPFWKNRRHPSYVRVSPMFDSFALYSTPQDDELLRAPLRALLAEHVAKLPPSRRARSWMGFDADFSRALGSAGFLGLMIPRRYGGQERGAYARFVVSEELLSIGAPVAAHWVADRQSAQLILHYGTEDQRRAYLPGICAGTTCFCIGMSEPNAGSDLASVRTRAARAGEGWLLNGQKIWTSFAQDAHYMMALVRTSGTADDRHRGLSQFIIDLKTPGITVRPIVDLTGDAHFTEVFFQDVDLPADALIGEEGAGWEQVTAELAFERSGPERILSSIVLLDTWIDYLKTLDEADIANVALVGRLMAELAVLRSMSLSVTAQLAKAESPTLEASLVKDIGTSFEQSIPRLIADRLGARADGVLDAELMRTLAFTTQIAPAYSLRGGTREILRGIIARGLGSR